jgi:hypothetical protein
MANLLKSASVMIVIATDASVDARNLKRLAARATLGLGSYAPCAAALMLSRILEEAGKDAHYSVRAAATESDPATSNPSEPPRPSCV